jgi:acyl-CoA synthetase (AMP-forming)/AMP-acid ligase II
VVKTAAPSPDATPISAKTPVRALIEERASQHGESTFLLMARSDQRVTFAQLRERIDQWRDVLDAQGLRSGDSIALVIGEPVALATCLLALLAVGAWAAPLDPALALGPSALLNARLDSLKVRWVISDQAVPQGTSHAWCSVSSRTFAGHARAGGQTTRPFGGGVILATSGSTGTPKVTLLAVRQLLDNASLVAHHNEFGPLSRGLNPLPLWHVNAEVVALLASLVASASLVLDDRFHRSGFWAVVDRFDINWINAVPAIIARLATLREGEKVPEGVRFIRSASAPLPAALLEKFETTFRIPVIESYGMTEAASQICANDLAGPRKPGSVGRPVGVELRVRCDTDQANGGERVGEIEIRGSTVIRRYEGTGHEDRFDKDGWLRTGDIGYVDEDGFVFLVGRSDDVINRGGEKFFPREVEELILDLDDVVDAAVIGVPDEVFGHVAVLYVQLRKVTASTPLDQVRAMIHELDAIFVSCLSRARRPIAIYVVETMPRHATGKILRKALGTDQAPAIFLETLA